MRDGLIVTPNELDRGNRNTAWKIRYAAHVGDIVQNYGKSSTDGAGPGRIRLLNGSSLHALRRQP